MPMNENFVQTRRDLWATRADLAAAQRAAKLYQCLAIAGWTGLVLLLLGV